MKDSHLTTEHIDRLSEGRSSVKTEPNHCNDLELSQLHIDRKAFKKDEAYRDKIFELKKENLLFTHENVYESCCFRIDKRVLDYFVKMFVIFSVVIFSMVKLVEKTANETERSIYTTMLWSMVTLLIPSPKINEQK